MRYRVLGGLEVIDGERSLELGGRKQRAVLAALVLDAGQPVSVDRLIDAVWGDGPPERAEASLQTYVSNLRRLLEPGRGPRKEPAVLLTRPAGYVLQLTRNDVDLTQFEDLIEEGRACRREGHPGEARELLTKALGLWAPVLPEYAGEPFLREVEARLTTLHGLALEELFDARLELGDHDAAVADLEAAVLRHPLRERLWGQLALAHYRAGRQTDALRVLQRARRLLDDEVGVEPGPDLRQLEGDILELETETDMNDATHRSPLTGNRRPWAAAASAGVLFASFLVVGGQPALAHGGAETFTAAFKDAAEIFPNTDPCSGVRETVEATQSGVFHLTRHADGHYQMGGTVTGEFTAVPDNPARPTYVGKFTVRFGQNDGAHMDNAQFTNTIRAEGSDGSIRAFHGVAHITAAHIDFSAEPATVSNVKVAFEKFRCK